MNDYDESMLEYVKSKITMGQEAIDESDKIFKQVKESATKIGAKIDNSLRYGQEHINKARKRLEDIRTKMDENEKKLGKINILIPSLENNLNEQIKLGIPETSLTGLKANIESARREREICISNKKAMDQDEKNAQNDLKKAEDIVEVSNMALYASNIPEDKQERTRQFFDILLDLINAKSKLDSFIL